MSIRTCRPAVQLPPTLARAALAVACLGVAASAQLVFEPPQVVSSVPGDLVADQSELLVADLDGDAHLDLVVSDGPFLSASLTTHLNQGDGSFQLDVQPPLPGVLAEAAGDVDGDGHVDLIASDQGSGALQLRRGLGDGTFGAAEPVPGVHAVRAWLAHLDADGQLDLVTSGSSPDLTYRAMLGRGDGTFASWWSAPKSFFDLHVGQLADLDGDGSLDLLHGWAGASWQVVYGLDGGATPPTISTHPFGIEPLVDLDAADVDGDGRLDVIATKASGVVLLHNLGPDDFGDALVLDPPDTPRELLPGDVDGDGLADLLLTTGADELVAWRALGASTFGAPLHVSHVPRGGDLRLADVDGAGFADVLATTRTPVGMAGDADADVRLLRNHTYAPGSPFLDLGGGLPGAPGWPVLLADGEGTPGGPWSLELANAAPLETSVLVLGATRADLPFKGGTLIPFPDLLTPSLTVGADGRLLVADVWPTSASGLTLWLQWWIRDPGGVWGWAASSGVRVELP